MARKKPTTKDPKAESEKPTAEDYRKLGLDPAPYGAK